MASVRGDDPVLGPPWTAQIWLEPLQQREATDVFLSIAPRIARDNPDLDFFLAEKEGVLGGIPLAITLVASSVARNGNLHVLRHRWERVGITLAKRLGVAEGRLDSVVQSIAV
jgi:hypothetical protein